MNITARLRSALLVVLAACTGLVTTSTPAQPQPSSGREYQELRPARPVSSGARIEVIEFFYYGCPVCYETQPQLSRWLFARTSDVSLVRVPAISSDGWEPFARTFYTLEAMGQLGRLHWPVYDNHHFDGKQLNEEKNIIAWVSANGLDGAKFSQIWNSPETRTKIGAAQKMVETYGIRGVPTFVVDGKYVTSARMAGGVKQMIDVLEFLVMRARSERPRT